MCHPAALRSGRLGAILLAGVAWLGGAAGLAAQTAPSADYFDVRARKSAVRSVDGETVLELTDDVVVVHGDVQLNANRGVSFTQRRVTQLFGNVRVRQQTITMTGEEGEYRQFEDLSVLRRNVRIVDQGMVITCDEARYSRRTGEAWLLGNVVGRDSTSVIRADRLLYVRGTGRAEAFGNVEITDDSQGIVATGRHGTFNRMLGEGVIDQDPRLVAGAGDDEPVTVVSDTMRVYPDSARATAYYRVKIIKGETVTQCDSAMVYDDQQRVELFGNPLAKQGRVTMQGDRMVAYYNEDEIHRIDILGSAMITEVHRDSLVTGRDSWIRGDSIMLHLREGGVDSLRVNGNASSRYFPLTPGKVEENSIAGDAMYFQFGPEQIDFVDVAGKASGVYRYVNLGRGETADSLRALADTSLSFVAFPGGAETVKYSAERIRYYASSKDLVLEESAQVDYRDSQLAGETITYHSTLQVLDAHGSPTLTDGSQKILGERMNFDMESRTGLVTEGSTKYEQGFYSGENLAKVGEDEMKVWNSWYTTCDLKAPHYHFAARTMKVYPDDKVFTGPIWLHVGKTPLFALPFMANSIQRGRRSGFLRPDFEFGFTSTDGRFIRNIGYYWATNDYTDFTFVGDFYEDDKWRVHVGNQYALRYRFNGTVDFNYVREINDRKTEWTFDSDHSQILGEKAGLTANLRFVSSDDAPQDVNTIDDVNRYIDRSIRSNVSLRKSWDTVGFSASASRTQNLNIEDPASVKLRMTLPNVTLSIPSRNLYFGSDGGAADSFWEGLLKNTRYSPSLSAVRDVQEKLFEDTEIVTARAGLSFSSPQKLAFLNLSPSLSANFTSIYTDTNRTAHFEFTQVGTAVDTTFVPAIDNTVTENEFNWSTGVSANTNFYGTFYPNVGRLRGIRHSITPGATYSYTPGRDGRPRSQLVSLSLRNALDLKVAKTDTTTVDSDIRRLSSVVGWSLGTSYRPDTPSERAWSTIGSGLNLVIAGINLSLNHAVDPYTFDILNTSGTTSFSFRGTHGFGKSSNVEVLELNLAAASDTVQKAVEGNTLNTGGVEYVQTGDGGPREGDELALQEGRLPWSLTLGLSYSKPATGPVNSTLRVGWDVKLTDHWAINYSTIYDVEDRLLTGQNFTITRDLHCWEMSMSRQQLGDEWEYYFRITLKAHPELYGESGQRNLGGGLIGQF